MATLWLVTQAGFINPGDEQTLRDISEGCGSEGQSEYSGPFFIPLRRSVTARQRRLVPVKIRTSHPRA